MRDPLGVSPIHLAACRSSVVVVVGVSAEPWPWGPDGQREGFQYGTVAARLRVSAGTVLTLTGVERQTRVIYINLQ